MTILTTPGVNLVLHNTVLAARYPDCPSVDYAVMTVHHTIQSEFSNIDAFSVKEKWNFA